MTDLQLLVIDLNGTQLGEIELTDSKDFALKLTKSIADIKNVGKRSTSYSLDFKAPKTKNNNKLLDGIRFINHSKEVLGKKRCRILVKGNQIDTGFLYAFETQYKGDYKLVFKGGNNDWVEQLTDVYLNTLEWRDYRAPFTKSVDALELFDSSRFSVLNSGTAANYDLIYPYVNRNNGGAVADFRPQLHLKAVILAMFDKIGYTVDSSFLNDDWLTGGVAFTDSFGKPYTHLGLSIDPAFVMTREQLDILSFLAQYKSTGITPNQDPNTWTVPNLMSNLSDPLTPNIRTFYRFPNLINNLIEDDNTRFDVLKSEYTVGLAGVYSIKFNFLYEWAFYNDLAGIYETYTQVSSPFFVRPPNFKWYVVKNNTLDDAIDGIIIFQGSSPIPENIQDVEEYHTLSQGDKISVFLEIIDDALGLAFTYLNGPGSLKYWRLRMLNDSVLTIIPKRDIELGNEFRINSHIPSNIKCLDLLQDFKTMFNLYFEADPQRRVVKIEPRDVFYQTTNEDITELVDLSTAPVINYLTDYKTEFDFQYNSDSKDKYLEQWQKINDRTYAEYTHEFANASRFKTGRDTLKTGLIAPTIQGSIPSQNIITSIIKEEWLDADNLNKGVNRDYGIRVFQLVRGTQYDTAGVIRRTASPFDVTVAIMEAYAGVPTFEDRKLTFIGERGLVWDYYRKTLTNIDDTAIVKLKLKLNLYQFRNWDLSKTYYIDSPEEIKGYYITNSIDNFNITEETPVSVTLVKTKNFVPATVTGGSGNINSNTPTPSQPQPILVEVNGAIVNCLDNNFQVMYKI